MKDKILRNIGLNIIITFSTGILAFISNKTFALNMGVEKLGLMSLFTQLITYLNLAELGVGVASSYALYKPLMNAEHERINIIISTLDNYYKKIAFFIFGIGIGVNLFLPYIAKSNLSRLEVSLYWSLYVFNTALTYVFAKYSILFTANQEYGFVRKIQGIGRVVFQILQILILIYLHSFFLFILAMTLENIFCYYYYNKHYLLRYNYIDKTTKMDKNLIKDIKNLFVHKVGSALVFNTDYIVIAKFISLVKVGLYSNYMLLYNLCGTLINIITAVITPNIGAFIAKNDKENIFKYWKQLNSAYAFLGIFVATLFYKMANNFIYLWLGEEYLLSDFTVLLISINLYLLITRILLDVFKTNSGFFDDIYIPILEGAINLLMSIYLVIKIGIDGVLIGTLLSNVLVVYLIKPAIVFKRCFNKRSSDWFVYLLVQLIISACILFSLSLIEKMITINYELSWVGFIKNVLLISTETFVIIFIFFSFNLDFRKNIINFLKKIR